MAERRLKGDHSPSGRQFTRWPRHFEQSGVSRPGGRDWALHGETCHQKYCEDLRHRIPRRLTRATEAFLKVPARRPAEEDIAARTPRSTSRFPVLDGINRLKDWMRGDGLLTKSGASSARGFARRMPLDSPDHKIEQLRDLVCLAKCPFFFGVGHKLRRGNPSVDYVRNSLRQFQDLA